MIETVEVKYTKSRSNIFHVAAKKWREWSPMTRQVFNEVLSSMRDNQNLFIHPKQEKISNTHWGTVAWNAAWTAAEACNR